MNGQLERLIDVTGVVLIPGDNGKNCLGNGEYKNENRAYIECYCDECNYYLECFPALH